MQRIFCSIGGHKFVLENFLSPTARCKPLLHFQEDSPRIQCLLAFRNKIVQVILTVPDQQFLSHVCQAATQKNFSVGNDWLKDQQQVFCSYLTISLQTVLNGGMQNGPVLSEGLTKPRLSEEVISNIFASEQDHSCLSHHALNIVFNAPSDLPCRVSNDEEQLQRVLGVLPRVMHDEEGASANPEQNSKRKAPNDREWNAGFIFRKPVNLLTEGPSNDLIPR